MTALLRLPSGRGKLQTREDFPDAVDLHVFRYGGVTWEVGAHRISRLTVRASI
jgi:hypothetical protein